MGGVAGGDLAALGKGGRTRVRILDAAAALFARHGVASVSMGDVAAAVGLRAGSLYFHFPSKSALADEVLARGIAEGLAHVQAELDGVAGATAAVRLRVAIEAHLVALRQVSDYASVIAQAVADRGVAATAAPPLERLYAGLWARLLDDARADGALAPGLDPRLVRDLLFGAMNSLTMRTRDPHDVAEAIAVLIGLDGISISHT